MRHGSELSISVSYRRDKTPRLLTEGLQTLRSQEGVSVQRRLNACDDISRLSLELGVARYLLYNPRIASVLYNLVPKRGSLGRISTDDSGWRGLPLELGLVFLLHRNDLGSPTPGGRTEGGHKPSRLPQFSLNQRTRPWTSLVTFRYVPCDSEETSSSAIIGWNE